MSTGDQNRRPIAPCCALLSRWGLQRARRAPKTPPQATSQAPQRRTRESKFLSLDVSDALQRVQAGTGDPSFQDLGFEDGELFVVRGDEESLHLLLATDEEEFSIQAAAATSSTP